MTTFDQREDGFEKKFALDEAQKFKAESRRNGLLGLWAAALLGLSGDAATAYAKEVVASEFDGAGGAIRRVSGDLAAANVNVSAAQINAKMDELMAQAIIQIKAGG